jgi:hypothetical protein
MAAGLCRDTTRTVTPRPASVAASYAADLPRAENRMQPVLIRQRNQHGDGLGGTHLC